MYLTVIYRRRERKKERKKERLSPRIYTPRRPPAIHSSRKFVVVNSIYMYSDVRTAALKGRDRQTYSDGNVVVVANIELKRSEGKEKKTKHD